MQIKTKLSNACAVKVLGSLRFSVVLHCPDPHQTLATYDQQIYLRRRREFWLKPNHSLKIVVSGVQEGANLHQIEF